MHAKCAIRRKKFWGGVVGTAPPRPSPFGERIPSQNPIGARPRLDKFRKSNPGHNPPTHQDLRPCDGADMHLERVHSPSYRYCLFSQLCLNCSSVSVNYQYFHHFICCLLFLVPGSSRVKDALGDTIPPAPPLLRSLFNLIPADAHLPEIFLDDIFPVLSRST